MEAQEFFQGSYYQAPPYAAEKRHADVKTAAGDHFMVEDLLDFPNDDNAGAGDGTFDAITGGSTDSSTVTAIDSCNSSFSGADHQFAGDFGSRNSPAALCDTQFSGDLCVPYDDLAELEWLSNFVEESFCSEDLQKLQLISGIKAQPVDEGSETREFQPDSVQKTPTLRPELSVPGKARSKRSRAAPGNWTSRLLLLSPSSSAAADFDPSPAAIAPINHASVAKKTIKGMQRKEACGGAGSGGDGRKCLHCATDKTPQWRTGPMGPKTLCNACGVRYKSGRLVPEYRPAASPTFVLTKHSNSHRKVLELRRQKEMIRSQPHHHGHHSHHSHQQQQQYLQQSMMFDVSNGEDYLIHQHVGPDFGQLI